MATTSTACTKITAVGLKATTRMERAEKIEVGYIIITRQLQLRRDKKKKRDHKSSGKEIPGRRSSRIIS